jgi:LPS-assembly protein
MPSPRPRAIGIVPLLALILLLASPGAPIAQPARPEPLRIPQEGGGEVSVIADQLQQVGGATNLVVATGNVEIVRGATRLLADRVELNRDTGEAIAQGKVVFFDGQDRLVGDRIDYNLRTGTGVVYNGSAFSAPYYRVGGDRMDRVGEGIYEMKGATFTTCEDDPPTWSFRVGEGTADLNEIIYGRHVSFWVGKVPLLPWFPFFAAAIRRERQSGFLFPAAGVSSRKGYFMKVPYFWAIDDSQDLTASLDVYTERGVGATAEYRYILSQDSAGTFSGFMISEVFQDNETRGLATYQHAWQVTPGLSVKVDANVVSDDLVLRDYADRLADRTRQRAETNVFVSRSWDRWSLVGNILWYQDLTTSRPVELQRVPDIRLEGLRQPIPGLPGFLYEVRAGAAYFLRDLGSEGPRVDLHPRIYRPIPVAGLFTITPFAGGRATYYNKRVINQRVIDERLIDDDTRAEGGHLVEETEDDNHVRLQIEGGMEMESRIARVWTVGGTWGLAAVQHVIEPRVTWTEIRGLDQKANPQFDPAIDNIGKRSQVAYSLTQRINAKTQAGPNEEPVRWEAARFTVAQIFNLLPAADEPFKDLAAELIVRPKQYFGLRGVGQWNMYGLGLRTANADVFATYRDFTVAVGARFNEISSPFTTVTAAVAGRIGARVHVRASTEYDVLAGTKVENRVGVDILWQCWALLLEYVDRHKDEDEIRFSVNLLGVGQTGTRFGAGGFLR